MSLSFIDTHCHIHSFGLDVEAHTAAKWAKLGKTPEQLIATAKSANVRQFICVGTDLADSTVAVEFAASHEGCYAAVGIHPHEAKRYIHDKAARVEFTKLLKHPKVVAIGECGLDYFYNHSEPKDQLDLLKFQLDLASEHQLPLIFHVREAFADFWPVYNTYHGLRGVLHSFTDTIETLQIATSKGLLIGVNGIATFAKSALIQEMYRSIPLHNLLLETDAPYLTPTPYRGNINEPKYIVRVAEYLSELRSIDLGELAKATTNNAKTLFGI